MTRPYRFRAFRPRRGQIWFEGPARKSLKVSAILSLRAQFPFLPLAQIGLIQRISGEWVRQILKKHKGSDPPGFTLPQLASETGFAITTLRGRVKRRGIKPIGRQGRALLWAMESKVLILALRPRKPLIRRVCETCGCEFWRAPRQLGPHSPGRFHSKRCQGVWVGRNFGWQKRADSNLVQEGFLVGGKAA